ncbi:MAG: hypothetical protein KIT09_19770 [Bryobacteraceae bacterium]|nr:hypothetical protein [Bryobacteraceae bacterium]
MRHGLLTASTLAAGDDPAEFQEFANQLRTEYRPANALEEIQAACIIDCLWRLRRLQQVEAGAFAPVEEPARFPGLRVSVVKSQKSSIPSPPVPATPQPQ